MDGSAKAAKIIGCWIMEREVGDEFEVNDVVLRVVEASNRFSCDGCYFLECDRTACEFQNCLKCERNDGKSVVFQFVGRING